MTSAEISDLYFRIARVTTRYEFTAPVESEDLRAVRDALVEALPANYRVDLESLPDTVRVQVWRPDGQRLYARDMLVA